MDWDYLGKKLYPRVRSGRRVNRAKALVAAVMVGLLFSVVMVLIMWFVTRVAR